MMIQVSEATTEGYAADYKRVLRAAVRGAWLRALTYDQTLDSIDLSVQRGLTNAWNAGAAAGGILPTEFTPEEQGELKRFILGNRMRVGGFVDSIFDAPSKEEKGLLRPHLARVDLWVNTWWAVYATAQAMAAKDQKMKFTRVRVTKEPCRSCAGLEGRVYRNSTWLANNCIPPSRSTDCQGYRCGHKNFPTDERLTPGRFPRGLLRY